MKDSNLNKHGHLSLLFGRIRHQYQMFFLSINPLASRQKQRTIVMVLHDLNLACRYAHHVVAIHNKGIFVQGKPIDIITANMVKTVFGLECEIIKDPLFGTPMCIPFGKGRVVPLSRPAKASGFGDK